MSSVHRFDIWAFAAIALVGALASLWLPLYDFEMFFYPAIVEAAHLRDPYTVEGFYNPPWTLIPFLPLGWMDLQAAKTFFFAGMLVCFLLVPYKLGLKWWAILLFVLSPPVLACLWIGNLEWVVLLGLIVPAPFSTLLYLVKPQVGIGLALLTLVEKKGRPLTMLLVAVLVGIWCVPGWTTRSIEMWGAIDSRINWSIWPLGLLLGIPALAVGLFARKRDLCLAVGPLLSPYVLMYSMSGMVLGSIQILGGKRCQQ